MAYTRTSKITRWRARIVKYEAELLVIDAFLLGTTDIQEYRFDAGEGSQRVQYKSLDDLAKRQRYLEATIDSLERKICGGGFVRMSIERRGGIY